MQRRRFLKSAGAGLAAGAALAPAIARAQAKTIRWKLQSANPPGTPHIYLLNKLAANIDKMSGGRLRIEILPSGAIVKPNETLDAVSKGLLDSGQWWTHYATGKHAAGGLFSAPLGGSATGLDQANHLAWYMVGGGRDLYLEYYQKILKANVQPFLYAPDGPEALGWFKQPIKSVKDLLKLRFRISNGLPSDVLKEMGGTPMNISGAELIPAAERGVLDGVEWINPANDIKVGLQDVFKYYSIQGLHQAVGFADIIINGDKWKALSPDLQGIVEVAIHAAMVEAMVYFPQENAKALDQLRAKGVQMFDAPADYAPAWIAASRKVLARFEEKDPFFKKVLDSQRAFAKVVVPYARENAKLSQLISTAAD